MRTIENQEAFPDDLKSDFFAEEQAACKKLETLKTMISETFPVRFFFNLLQSLHCYIVIIIYSMFDAMLYLTRC